MEENVQEVTSGRSRKRTRNPETWKRAREKAERYEPKRLPSFPTCQHHEGKYKCRTLTSTDVRKFFQRFYSLKTRQEQDAFILKFCKVHDVKRRRPRTGIRTPNKLHTRLFVKKGHTLRLVPVCQKSFLGILQITVHRIRHVAKTFKETGLPPKEKRGGDRSSYKYLPKRLSIKRFIESFKCLESHYCRSSVERKYLDSSLNIKKMWKMYCQANPDLPVKESYFRHYFNTHYNIGFGTPRTDVCSKCTELQTKIKCEKDTAKKNDLMIEKRVHLLKARAFYRLLREQKDNMVTLSFDCQKNQILPKIPDQIAYYSRQLYIFNFAVVKSTPDKRLNNETVSLYSWTEDEFKKGANEIASAVYHRLNQLTICNEITTVRLLADGCGAQNKNSIMVGMCATWLINAPSTVRRIELVFPVPGHSYLPADRVFGNIEREIKKKEEILRPEEYNTVFSNYGTVVNFEDMALDWKSALNTVIKPPGSWHFQFAACKHFYIRRNSSNKIFISGEINYNSTSTPFKSVLKRGKSFKDVIPAPIEKGKVTIKGEKINDVNKLLIKHFGNEWRSKDDLQYYKKVCDGNVQVHEEDEEEVCEPCEPEVGLMI